MAEPVMFAFDEDAFRDRIAGPALGRVFPSGGAWNRGFAGAADMLRSWTEIAQEEGIIAGRHRIAVDTRRARNREQYAVRVAVSPGSPDQAEYAGPWHVLESGSRPGERAGQDAAVDAVREITEEAGRIAAAAARRESAAAGRVLDRLLAVADADASPAIRRAAVAAGLLWECGCGSFSPAASPECAVGCGRPRPEGVPGLRGMDGVLADPAVRAAVDRATAWSRITSDGSSSVADAELAAHGAHPVSVVYGYPETEADERQVRKLSALAEACGPPELSQGGTDYVTYLFTGADGARAAAAFERGARSMARRWWRVTPSAQPRTGPGR